MMQETERIIPRRDDYTLCLEEESLLNTKSIDNDSTFLVKGINGHHCRSRAAVTKILNRSKECIQNSFRNP